MKNIDKNAVSGIMDTYSELTKKTCQFSLHHPERQDDVLTEMTLRLNLTPDEKGAFVDRVVDHVFTDDGDFLPHMLDPLFMITLIQMTTNVPVFQKMVQDKKTGEKHKMIDIEKTYTLAKALNLRTVPNVLYQNLIDELQQMVKEKVEYRKQLNVRKSENVLTNLQTALEGVMRSLDDISKQENVKELLFALQNEKENMSSSEKVVRFPEVKQNGD